MVSFSVNASGAYGVVKKKIQEAEEGRKELLWSNVSKTVITVTAHMAIITTDYFIAHIHPILSKSDIKMLMYHCTSWR